MVMGRKFMEHLYFRTLYAIQKKIHISNNSVCTIPSGMILHTKNAALYVYACLYTWPNGLKRCSQDCCGTLGPHREGVPLSPSKPLGCAIARTYCLCAFKTQKKKEGREFQCEANLHAN